MDTAESIIALQWCIETVWRSATFTKGQYAAVMTAESKIPVARAQLATRLSTCGCCRLRTHFGAAGISYLRKLHLKVILRFGDEPSSFDESCWVDVSLIHEFPDGTIHSCC
jgi:hypothetical protein